MSMADVYAHGAADGIMTMPETTDQVMTGGPI